MVGSVGLAYFAKTGFAFVTFSLLNIIYYS
jgi:hypothetical protein